MSLLDSSSDCSIDPQSLEAFLEEGSEDDRSEDTRDLNLDVKRRCMSREAEESSRADLGSFPSKSGLFGLLPNEVSYQLLERLSAVDLTSISQTCKFFSGAARANELWRPLYSCRWREAMRENTGLLDQPSWKVSYMDRDAQSGEKLTALISDKTLQTSYLQSMVAERHMTVPRLPQFSQPSNKALWGRITRWRGARGLLACPSPALGSEHLGCGQRGPFLELIGGLYMCESCGWAHLCGDGCPERLVDEVSESLVCPISGRCFDRMIQDWEEDGREDQDVDTGCDFGIAGHWGRAYSVGYNCSSEEELRFKCGVVM